MRSFLITCIRLLWIPQQNPSKTFKVLLDSTTWRRRNNFRKTLYVMWQSVLAAVVDTIKAMGFFSPIRFCTTLEIGRWCIPSISDQLHSLLYWALGRHTLLCLLTDDNQICAFFFFAFIYFAHIAPSVTELHVFYDELIRDIDTVFLRYVFHKSLKIDRQGTQSRFGNDFRMTGPLREESITLGITIQESVFFLFYWIPVGFPAQMSNNAYLWSSSLCAKKANLTGQWCKPLMFRDDSQHRVFRK